MTTQPDTPQERLRHHQDARRKSTSMILQLRRARLQALTPRQQEITRLYFDEGQTMAQIAQSLGVHTSTISRTLLRSRARLQRHLERPNPAPYIPNDDA